MNRKIAKITSIDLRIKFAVWWIQLSKLLIRWKDIIVITILIKLLLIVISLISSPGQNILNLWNRWDYSWYIDIARDWYQTTARGNLYIVFYPFYPLLIKAATLLTNNFMVSTLLVSITFSFFSSIALFELTLLDFSKKTALKAVWFLNIFPTAYFLQASYTESIFLALTLATCYFFLKKRYFTSGLFGALSTMTRVNGILLLPLLIMEAKKTGKNLLTFLLLPTGFLIYLLINYITFGKPFYFTEPLYTNWFKKADFPWIGINSLIRNIPNYSSPNFYIHLSEISAIIFIIIMTIIVYFRVRRSYALYMLLNLLLFTSTTFILSTPRYTLSLFPIFMALGLINNRLILIIISLISISLLFFFTNLYTQGGWTF